MAPKKQAKIQARWQPLPEGASTMQVMVVPEIDDHQFRPEVMTMEELINLCQYIDQSNRTLEVENMVKERYLRRMEPNALARMNQILEATAIAMQKTEKTTHVGGGTSTASLSVLAKKMALDDSLSSSSRVGTSKSSPSPINKLGLFCLADKGPKVQAAQKIEIVNREIDELKNSLEIFRKKARIFNYTLMCRNQEMKERLHELMETQTNFEQKLLVESLDPLTGKLPGEKFLRYLEMKLKTGEIEIDRMRIKTGALKSHLKRVMQQLAQKEELGEILHVVDFEQLQIENKDCQVRLDEKISHVTGVKRINGKYGNILNANKKKLQEQMNKLTALQQNTVIKEKMIKQFMEDEEKVNTEISEVAKRVEKILRLMKSYTVPDLMKYISKKSELYDLKKNIKVCERKLKLKDLALASQVHRIKSIHEEYSKSASNLDSLTQTLVKQSQIYF